MKNKEKRNLNICMIPSPYPYKSNPCHGDFVREQAKTLVREGLRVHVVAAGDNTPKEENDNGVNVHRVIDVDSGHKPLFLFKYLYRVLSTVIVLNRKEEFDVIHSHFADHAGLAGLAISKILGKPFILTAHGYDIYSDKEFEYGWGQSWITRYMIKLVVTKADRICAVSNALKREIIEKYSVNQHKIVVIPNGTRIQKVPEKERLVEFRSRYNLINRKIILCVSALIKRKGNQNVIMALPYIVDKIPDVIFIIVGEGPYKQELEDLTKELNLEDNVMIVDRLVLTDELPLFYCVCDVFVLMSWLEAFGLVYTEASFLGKPLIGSIGGGAEDIIIDGETGYLVDPANIKELADRLMILLTNKDLREGMGKKGRELVMKQFLWEHNVASLMEVYKNVLGDKR